MKIYKLSEKLSDEIWEMVLKWEHFQKNTIGTQLVNAADGVGSNIAEGFGKGSYMDFRRYMKISCGSLYETKHWLRRAHSRKLMTQEETRQIKPLVDELHPRINSFINYLNKKISDSKNSL